MRIEQSRWTTRAGWHFDSTAPGDDVRFVLAFGGTDVLGRPEWLTQVRERYPAARVVSCSTAGEICGTEVTDDTIVATAVAFQDTRVEAVAVPIGDASQSREAGIACARALPAAGLRHVLVFSEGLAINGTALAAGMREALAAGVVVTGGLAGDGARMDHTAVGLDTLPAARQVVAVGLYGDRLRVGYGSLGGWNPFGPERLVTRAEGNVLFELDGQPALDLYRRYLGEHAAGLPSTGLLFPLAIRTESGSAPLVRTILGIDEAHGSITFAGDLPVGSYARLMRANFDRLVEGAVGAAQGCLTAPDASPELAILISCVGRKLLLGQRIEEEVEGVRDVLGPAPVLAGFYSYGELCPHVESVRCELHNQTMTITTLAEA